MSRTLFWYVFRDLLRIFFMAAGALAGIMSFGGLLRPLTEHGLNAGQVGKMLTYFTPAMTTYSFPVAALFAATMVYGRLSADNELTACRACGISYVSMTAPALVLGLLVAIISLLFLLFIVPIYTLKVEKVVYSNIAQLVQNEIERTHQIKFDDFTVFAQSAELKETDPARPFDQRVELIAPMIVTYDKAYTDKIGRVRPPQTFYMATKADVYIRPRGSVVEVDAALVNGIKFGRDIKLGSQLFTARTQFGPFKFPSPVREDTKFMDIRELKGLVTTPERSRRLEDEVHDLVRQQMVRYFGTQMRNELNSAGRFGYEAWRAQSSLTGSLFTLQMRAWRNSAAMATEQSPVGFDWQFGCSVPKSEDPTRDLPRVPGSCITIDNEYFQITRGDEDALFVLDQLLVIRSKPQRDARQVRIDQKEFERFADHPRFAKEVRLTFDPQFAQPDDPWVLDSRTVLAGAAYDVLIPTGHDPSADAAASRATFHIEAPILMSPALAGYRFHTVADLEKDPQLPHDDVKKVIDDQRRIVRKITSEIHSRASFAVSCLVLVMVGCALGMMFKSGNFLSAFTVSFIPAMISIALIVTGQQICGSVAGQLSLGLGFIWAGNGMVFTLATILLTKLQRQ